MSRLPLLSLLTGAVVVLGAVVAVELWSGTGGDGDAAMVMASNRNRGIGTSTTATILSETLKDAPQLATQILARPLFAINRRPDEAAPAETSESIVSDLPRLAGIVMIMNAKFAIFQPRDGSKPIVVGVGDTVDGRKIQAIAIDEIVLIGPDGAEHLHPMPDSTVERVAPPIPRPPFRNIRRPPQQRRRVILTP